MRQLQKNARRQMTTHSDARIALGGSSKGVAGFSKYGEILKFQREDLSVTERRIPLLLVFHAENAQQIEEMRQATLLSSAHPAAPTSSSAHASDTPSQTSAHIHQQLLESFSTELPMHSQPRHNAST